MSAYKLFESIQFPNAQLLVSALAEMGYKAQTGEAQVGYGKKTTCQIVLRRQDVKGACYDMGFAWNGQAFVPVIEDYDATKTYDQAWRNRLQATYAKLAALVFCARKQARIGQVQTLPDGTLTFSATMEVRVQ